MTERQWLDEYSDQSTAELLALEATHRVDSLVLAFEAAIQRRVEEAGLESLSDVECFILVIEALEREVNNGGYAPFFVNESAIFTPVILDALAAIGAGKTHQITADALTALGLGETPDIAVMVNSFESPNPPRDQALETCDGRYFESGEDIAALLFSYIKSHSEDVRLP